MPRPTLTDIPGIGAASAAELKKAGIRGVKSLAGAALEKIEAVHGFGPAKSVAVKKAAQDLAPAEEKKTQSKPERPKKEGKGKKKKKKKKKKDKKDKGKKKKKKKKK